MVVEFRFAELDPEAWRDRRLNLEVDPHSPGSGGLDEPLDHGTLFGGQAVRRGRLIAQTPIEPEIGAEARGRPGPEFPLAPERPVQQADLPGPGVDGRLPVSGPGVGRTHHVGRGGHGRGRGLAFEIVEHPVDGLALEVLGQYGDADELGEIHWVLFS